MVFDVVNQNMAATLMQLEVTGSGDLPTSESVEAYPGSRNEIGIGHPLEPFYPRVLCMARKVTCYTFSG